MRWSSIIDIMFEDWKQHLQITFLITEMLVGSWSIHMFPDIFAMFFSQLVDISVLKSHGCGCHGCRFWWARLAGPREVRAWEATVLHPCFPCRSILMYSNLIYIRILNVLYHIISKTYYQSNQEQQLISPCFFHVFSALLDLSRLGFTMGLGVFWRQASLYNPLLGREHPSFGSPHQAWQRMCGWNHGIHEKLQRQQPVTASFSLFLWMCMA